ncbi:MAG: class II aldolase/adducin family protein, partial [Deltaproteobacteria bacterium]|nr:class II aldolase/adducin family protein [Deltaproteobacteria bacterium]
LHWSEVTASDMVLCDHTGTVLEGKHPVEETAFFIHSRVHRAKPGAVAVLHTHQPYTTALTLLEGGRLEMAGQNALMFDGRVAYEEGFNGLALDGDEGERLARALGDKDTLMMAGHGVLTTGPNLPMAFNDLYYLERACMFQVLARSHGGALRVIPQEVREKMRTQIREDLPKVARGHFSAIKRVLEREAPEFSR